MRCLTHLHVVLRWLDTPSEILRLHAAVDELEAAAALGDPAALTRAVLQAATAAAAVSPTLGSAISPRTAREARSLLKVARRRYRTAHWRRELLRLGILAGLVPALVAAGWYAAVLAGVLFRNIAGDGLRTTYFKDAHLEQACERTTLFRLSRDFTLAPLPRKLGSHPFSFRATGYLQVPRDGDYSFFSQCDDGLRVMLDGQVLMENWGPNNWRTSGRHANNVHLKAGAHELLVEYYFEEGEPIFVIKWKGGGIPPNTIIGYPYATRRK